MIAKTILDQIQAQDIFALSAWGVNELVDIGNGVQFKIRTPLYPKGVRVKIVLNVMDTYDIEVFRIINGKVNLLKNANSVYFDMLIETLDDLIEEDKKNIIIL